MITERDRVMAALREWASPGRRSQLLRDAWLAGEHSVVALADAAGVSRTTVYADLESHGINPRTDRQETRTVETITLNGFTGADDQEELDRRLRALVWGQVDADPDAHQVEARHIQAVNTDMETVLASHAVAKFHNALVPAAQAVQTAREDALRRLHVVETTWAALRTATAWHAAHHRWVEALADARAALTGWQQAADELSRTYYEAARGLSYLGSTRYTEYVPEDQRITPDPDGPRTASIEFEETTRTRQAIAVQTLSVQRPE